MEGVFAALGVDPQFYGVLAGLGILNSLLKARVEKWLPLYSLILAVVFSGVFGAASWITHRLNYWDGTVHTFTLLVAAVAVEFGLDLIGLKNNSLVKGSTAEGAMIGPVDGKKD